MNEQTEIVNEIVMTEEALQEEIGHLQGRINDLQLLADTRKKLADKAVQEAYEDRRRLIDARTEINAFSDRVKTLENNMRFALHMLEAVDRHLLTAKQLSGVLALVKTALDKGYWFNIEGGIPF